MTWYLEDEVTPRTEAVFDIVVQQGARTPSLFNLEVLNAFRTAMKKNRISQSKRDEALLTLQDLEIDCESDTHHRAWNAIRDLSDKYTLTPYDAAYLELAVRMRATLATLDDKLIAAARAEGIPVLP